MILLFWQFAIGDSFAQSFPNLTFRTLTTKDGLSSDEISGFAQGDDGQIWIGTQNGLNKYDGVRIEQYYKGNSKVKLQSNLIWQLSKDKSNHLWISDRSGVSKINIKTYAQRYFPNFTDVLNFAGKDEKTFVSNEGTFSISNDEKIKKNNFFMVPYTYQNTRIEKFTHLFSNNDEIKYFTTNNRIYRFKADQTLDTMYVLSERNAIQFLHFDVENVCWISTWNGGVFRIDPVSKKMLQLKLPGTVYLGLTTWKFNGNEYIALSGNSLGLVLIDKKTYDYKIYNIDKPVNNVFVDRDNNLWIATNNGVAMVSHLQDVIKGIPIGIFENKEMIRKGEVYTMTETDTHFWLTKRYGGGIYQYDKQWKLIHVYSDFPITNIMAYPTVADGFDFKQLGDIIYATNDAGIFRINVKTHTQTNIYIPDHSLAKLRNIVVISDTAWMIRSVDKGVYVFNPQKNMFNGHFSKEKFDGISVINFIFKTSENIVFVSTDNGLFTYSLAADGFRKIINADFTSQSMLGLCEDKNKLLWIGSHNGLMGYDYRRNKVVEKFENYPDMGITGRLGVDIDNHVWFGNAKGYWCWNQNKKLMTKLNFESGLITKTEQPSILNSKDNHIYLGGKDIIYKIDPNQLLRDKGNQKIIISSVKANKTEIYPTLILGHLNVILDPGTPNLDISFAIPDFSFEQSYEYSYKLDRDTSWTELEDAHLFIPNLSFGHYTIVMKGISQLNGRNTEELVLRLTVLPFWYQTIWFNVLVFAMLSFLIYSIVRWRIQMMHNKTRIVAQYEHKVSQLEMQNLRSQMNPHFIFNSLNSINSFIVENRTHLASDYLTKFSRLIRLILENSKNETISLSREIETLRLYLLMETVRFDQAFTYNIDIEDGIDIERIMIPPMVIQPFVENAIWHGLLQKPENGNVTIAITSTVVSKDESIQIEVIDNGIGREKAGAMNSKTGMKLKSYGIQITQQRLLLANQKNRIEIIDLKDQDGKPMGTKVRLCIY